MDNVKAVMSVGKMVGERAVMKAASWAVLKVALTVASKVDCLVAVLEQN